MPHRSKVMSQIKFLTVETLLRVEAGRKHLRRRPGKKKDLRRYEDESFRNWRPNLLDLDQWRATVNRTCHIMEFSVVRLLLLLLFASHKSNPSSVPQVMVHSYSALPWVTWEAVTLWRVYLDESCHDTCWITVALVYPR